MDAVRARFDDLARQAARAGVRVTRFLDPAVEAEARAAAAEMGVRAVFFGGYEEAERRVCAFATEGEEVSDWPIACIEARWNARFARAEHRDLLGALMALGVAREMFGDIVVGEGCAWLFVMRESVSYLLGNLESAGRARLSLREIDEVPDLPQPEGVQMRETVASTRLDAVLASGYSLSRENAKTMVTRGLVKLNHVEQLRPDVELEEGDLISLRGYGRLRLLQIQGRTRRGRLALTLFRYGKR